MRCRTRSIISAYRRLLAVVAVAAALLAAAPAQAQHVVVLVNGDPITAFDIEQRSKLIQLTANKTPARQEVIDELIEEKLKLQLLKRFTIEGMDNEVDNAYANMARRARMTPQGLTDTLEKSGIKPGTLKSRLKAEMTWSQIIRGRFQSSFQFSEKDVMAKLGPSKSGDALRSATTTRCVRSCSWCRAARRDGLRDTRRKEAEALRARFQSCEEGVSAGARPARRRGARQHRDKARPNSRRRCATFSRRPRSAS